MIIHISISIFTIRKHIVFFKYVLHDMYVLIMYAHHHKCKNKINSREHIQNLQLSNQTFRPLLNVNKKMLTL